jgi:uncharacterized membrane protein YgdD (TMEM256/DUF423 family)
VDRTFIFIAAVAGFLGVLLGAFGAHFLQDRLDPRMFNIFEVGVRYQMYHALALLFVGLLAGRQPSRLVNGAGWLFVIGIILFSGSLYLLALTGARWMGAITPVGGVAFLCGWALLALSAWKK